MGLTHFFNTLSRTAPEETTEDASIILWDDGDIMLWDDGTQIAWGELIWILEGGVWDDSAIWDDDNIWIDSI